MKGAGFTGVLSGVRVTALATSAVSRFGIPYVTGRGRPAGHRHGGREGPGRATGERLCLQRGRPTPRAPALRTSHSRAQPHPTTRHPGHKDHLAEAHMKENPACPLTTTKRT